MTMLALIASVPLTATWRQSLALPKKPLALKKTLIGTLGFMIIGWVMAYLAPRVMTPDIRVNMVSFSQLILTVSLISIGFIALVRLFQRNNLFSLIFFFIKRYFPYVVEVVGLAVTGIALLFIASCDDETSIKPKNQDSHLPEKDKILLDHGINYNGGFCDRKKMNWYE